VSVAGGDASSLAMRRPRTRWDVRLRCGVLPGARRQLRPCAADLSTEPYDPGLQELDALGGEAPLLPEAVGQTGCTNWNGENSRRRRRRPA
jgi:hypothetical protein